MTIPNHTFSVAGFEIRFVFSIALDEGNNAMTIFSDFFRYARASLAHRTHQQFIQESARLMTSVGIPCNYIWNLFQKEAKLIAASGRSSSPGPPGLRKLSTVPTTVNSELNNSRFGEKPRELVEIFKKNNHPLRYLE